MKGAEHPAQKQEQRERPKGAELQKSRDLVAASRIQLGVLYDAHNEKQPQFPSIISSTEKDTLLLMKSYFSAPKMRFFLEVWNATHANLYDMTRICHL